MAVDTPATIAILGAGPIGIEAALYARYLGYDVLVFDQGDVGAHIESWSDVTLFTPFEMVSTPLGLAALQAQDPSVSRPPADALLTGRQWLDEYLRPVAHSDLLAGCLRTQTRVVGVARQELHKSDAIGDAERRSDSSLRVLTESSSGEEAHVVDIVIDATGVLSQPNWIGAGGLPALGERRLSASDRIEYGIPTVAHCAELKNQRVAVVGNGYSAATTICRLAADRQGGESTRAEIVWIIRTDRKLPLQPIAGDRLPERARLAEQANALSENCLLVVGAIESVSEENSQIEINVERDGEVSSVVVDRIFANAGFRPDTSLFDELQVHLCYATGGPMKLAASLLQNSSPDCLDQASCGAATLIHPEPDFYVLGSKSYGRNSNFLLQVGHQQIREVFSIIGDRAELDLYATAKGLLG